MKIRFRLKKTGVVEAKMRGEKNESGLKHDKRGQMHPLMLWQPEAL